MPKAVILAAGRGTRMQGLTESVPKPMLPVNGKPILEHLLERLRAAGFREALIVTGYRAEAVEEHFRNYPLDLTFRRQETLDGTARAALLAEDFAGDEPFLLTFGDVLAEPSAYRGIVATLDEYREAEAAIGVKWVDDPWQGAAVYETGGWVTRIIEKPPKGTSATHWNSAGLFSFRRSIFDELRRVPKSPRGEYELTSAEAALLERKAPVRLFVIEGFWRDIGRPEDLEAARSTL
jgi:NDP-sugar pyrophosphorylase family protein